MLPILKNMYLPKVNIMMTTPGWVLLLFSFTARIPGKNLIDIPLEYQYLVRKTLIV